MHFAFRIAGLGAEEIRQLLGGERSGSPAGRGTSRGGAAPPATAGHATTQRRNSSGAKIL